ncbi:MmyB family transcriptional regulator [Streptomyces sp. S186]|uniref:MmyB family transcriptional regulator n=1 Tax=Streptomyces sp. S186 TaxID=3434395 RepID=UPI003F67FEBB
MAGAAAAERNRRAEDGAAAAQRDGRRRNTLRWLFTGRPRALAPHDRAQLARRFVADLRGSGRYPDDRGVRQLVAELSRESAEFAGLWARHEVGVNRTVTKTVDHPVAGVLELSCEVLAVPDSDQRVMVYTTAPGTGTGRALRGLRERAEERTADC